MSTLLKVSLRLTTHVLLLLALISGLGLAGRAEAQSDRGEVIAVREMQLKPGADAAAFEQFVRQQYNPAWEGAIPGLRAFILKGDRGKDKGTYLHMYVFDSASTRTTIFPTEGGGPSPAFQPLFDRMPSFQAEFDKYLLPGAGDAYTDYVVLK